MNKQKIYFDFPLPRTHYGVPLGNGKRNISI